MYVAAGALKWKHSEVSTEANAHLTFFFNYGVEDHCQQCTTKTICHWLQK